MVQTNNQYEYIEPAGGILDRLYQQFFTDDPLRSLLKLVASVQAAETCDNMKLRLPDGRGGCQPKNNQENIKKASRDES